MLDQTDRAATAVAAAASVGRTLGLTVTDPVVLYDAFSTVVHLRPSPVVARIPVALPDSLMILDRLAQRQQRELDVAQWVYDQGELVVRPSPLVPRSPIQQDGFSMTLWEFVDQAGEPDYEEGTVRAAALHAVLAEYPGDLPWFAPVLPVVPESLEQLSGDTPLLTGDDADRARREWEVLAPLVSSRAAWEQAFPKSVVQPVHGDAPYYNIIPTPQGVLWSDFEDVGVGPVEWDLVGVPVEYARRYDQAAADLGRPVLDPDATAAAMLARQLQLLICLPVAGRLPGMAEGLKPFVDQWREAPFAAGLAG